MTDHFAPIIQPILPPSIQPCISQPNSTYIRHIQLGYHKERAMPTTTSPTCPFCSIATAHPPLPPSSALQTIPQQQDNSYPGSSQRSHAFLVLSTKYVLAFLDIMPLSKGHLLVVTREHYEKVGELGVRIGEEVYSSLPIY